MQSRRNRNRTGYNSDDDDETSKLLRTIPPGISARKNNTTERTHSISGTQSVILEPPEVYKSRWRSIRVMYLTMFLSSVSFSICMSSLYPYLKILDPTANTNFLGWVVASYSVGQLIASPFFGAWSNLRSKTREPVIVSLFINVLANVLYMYLESIKTDSKLFLMVARVLVGFGAGNVAVVRSYVSGATTLSERTSAMANMSACQAIGFIIGPLIQTAMVPLGFPGPVYTEALHLDMYTATALFSAVVGIVNVVLLIVVFKEHTVKDDQFSPTNIQTSESTADIIDELEDSRPDYCAVIPTIMLFFSVLFIFAIFETIATPLSMHMFAWKKEEATLYVGVMLGCAGVVSIFVFAVIKVLSKRFNERYLLLGGFIMCLLGFVVYLPWGNHYPDIQYAEMDLPEITINTSINLEEHHQLNDILRIQSLRESLESHDKLLDEQVAGLRDGSNVKNRHVDKTIREMSKYGQERPSHAYLVLSNMTISAQNQSDFRINNGRAINTDASKSAKIDQSKVTERSHGDIDKKHIVVNQLDNTPFRPTNVSNNSTKEAVGCPYYYDWCWYTPAIFLWQFLLGTLFVAIGYPTCNVMSYTIFSKILGPKPQGIWMGWLTAAGSLARTLGPVFVSQVYDAYGPRVTFITLLGIIVLTIVGLLVSFRKLVPYKTNAMDQSIIVRSNS